ncbi:ROK family protein [Sphingomonas sp. R-74633]|uniref:ROK family protein n=1 Tax=Sphingomonas sp. R-74633 TaxID=2751188 RepID=UPI00211E5E21|nr:ROK family protein [Sphingomonas sp. R-74633]
METPLLAGVELGGTKIICTLGTGPDAIVDSRRIATGEAEPTLAAIEAVLDDWVRSYPSIAALGLASFGPLELDPAAADYGAITRTTKPGWSGTDLAGRIRRRYDLPLAFDTDVNGAALAEGRWGAARGLRSWVYITIGTGVGAGIIVNNRTVQGLGHSEAGHMVVRRSRNDSFAGICPFHGDCVEGLVSGPAIAAHTGLKGEHIPDDHTVWDSVSETIAEMIHNLAMSTAPERIILGGGVIERRPSLFTPIRRAVVESLAAYAHTPAIAGDIDRFIVPPALGAMAGPLGALALASTALPVVLAGVGE